jgi:hypothetical protein
MTMPDDFNPNLTEPPEECDEPDYDAELEFASLLELLLTLPDCWDPGAPPCLCNGRGDMVCSRDCIQP